MEGLKNLEKSNFVCVWVYITLNVYYDELWSTIEDKIIPILFWRNQIND